MMDAAREQQIRQRAEAATPGPWTYTKDPGYAGMYGWPPEGPDDLNQEGWESTHPPPGDANGPFIAHARQDIPDLLAALDAARAERDKLVDDAHWLSTQKEDLTLDLQAARAEAGALRERVATLTDALAGQRDLWTSLRQPMDPAGIPVNLRTLAAGVVETIDAALGTGAADGAAGEVPG